MPITANCRAKSRIQACKLQAWILQHYTLQPFHLPLPCPVLTKHCKFLHSLWILLTKHYTEHYSAHCSQNTSNWTSHFAQCSQNRVGYSPWLHNIGNCSIYVVKSCIWDTTQPFRVYGEQWCLIGSVTALWRCSYRIWPRWPPKQPCMW